MSSSRSRRPADAGFSLIELMVCLGLIVLVAGAVVPQLITGIRSNDLGKIRTQAKSLAQAQTEKMRNLPYHVAPDAGEYRDVLDTYYRNRSAPTTSVTCGSAGAWKVPTTAWTGYVAATGSKCAWEPTGPFYRKVETSGDFVVVTDTRFLSDVGTTTAVITPASDYNAYPPSSPTVPMDPRKAQPPSSQVGVTVAVFPAKIPISNPITTTTQIGRTDPSDPRMASRLDMSVVEVGTTTANGLPVTFSSGLVNLSASLTATSNATASLAGALTGVGTGEQKSGATAQLTAPPNGTKAASTAVAGTLGTTCTLVCWGASKTGALSVASTDGLPNVGSPTVPASATLDSTSFRGISLYAGPGSFYRPDLSLSTTQPLVRADTGASVKDGVDAGCTANSSTGTDGNRVTAAGWLRTTGDGAGADANLVEACGVSRTGAVSLLPTTFAPEGLIKVSLTRATTSCRVVGLQHVATATVGYAAVVQYWNGTSYTTVNVASGSATDPLAGIPLATTSVGSGHVLGDYVASWSTATTSSVTKSAGTGGASVALPGVVNIATVPVRTRSEVLVPSPTPTTSSPTATPTTTTPTPTPTTATPTPTATTATPTATATTASPTTTPKPTTTAGTVFAVPMMAAVATPTTATPTTATPTTATPTTATPTTATPSPTVTVNSNELDPASSVTLSLGTLSCSATDER